MRYVITLDADTVLPPDAAPLLVGALAHPLNRAVYDPALGRVVRGYGILQPRVGVSLPSAHRSRFAAIHSGHPGVDPYTTAVSDVYQDLYGEGSFTGKGIYDVDAFERATHGRFPENTLLSHDLIEGSYARAGLATDVDRLRRLPDALPHLHPPQAPLDPGRLAAAAVADARGCRAPTAPSPTGCRCSRAGRSSTTCAAARSRSPSSLFLVAGWTRAPGLAAALDAARASAPSPRRGSSRLLLALLRPPLDKSWRAYYAAVGRDAATSAQQVALAIVFLPHQAWVSADAIVRTLWRCSCRSRHLLEWQTASQTERGMSGSSRAVWRAMWPAVALAARSSWRGGLARAGRSPSGGAAPGSSRSRCCR